MSNTPDLPEDVYAVFAGPIEANTTPRFMNGLTTAVNARVKRVHLLVHSFGGNAADGICLYNFFRCLPLDLILYNVGNVASAAVTAFLGAKERKASAHACFMIHRTQAPTISATADRLHSMAQSVAIDDARSEHILREHIQLSDAQWDTHRTTDLWLSAKEALACGLIDEIAEFAPKPGSQIYNLTS